MKTRLTLSTLLLLVLAIAAFQACHTPAVGLAVFNDTGGCASGPCTILVTGAHDSPGQSAGHIGPDIFGPVSVDPGVTTSFKKVSSGSWHFTTQGSCHNGTFGPIDLQAGSIWTVTFFCGTTNARGDRAEFKVAPSQ